MPAQDTAPTPRGKDVTLAGRKDLWEQTRRPRAPKMTSAPGPEIRLNGVRYRWPDRPVVVVCNDGGDPAYFDRALKDGILPNAARFTKTGFRNALFRVSPAPTT